MVDGSMHAEGIRIDGTDAKNRVVSRVQSLQDWYSAELGRRLADLAEILNAELRSQIEELRRKLPSNDVWKEIAATESAVSQYTNKGSLELEGLTLNAASLIKLLQGAVEELETKAYLRGLKFRLPNTST